MDPKEKASRKALLAAKSNNIAQMEDALEEEVPINTADQFGNTLLILAAQQGSKRMCKFLLRRGANINSQSLSGNTPLHYCYAYNFPELGAYLKGKGADDSILNIDGMTCYEVRSIFFPNQLNLPFFFKITTTLSSPLSSTSRFCVRYSALNRDLAKRHCAIPVTRLLVRRMKRIKSEMFFY